MPNILRIYRRHPNALTERQKEVHRQAGARLLDSKLERLWGAVPEATFDLFYRVAQRQEIRQRAEREMLRAEVERLFDALVAKGWIRAEERLVVTEKMEEILRKVTPRGNRWLEYLRHPSENRHIISAKLRQIMRI